MIHKLEMLIALAREQHFGHAAESLGITQPTLSSGIRQLEEELGTRLVIRGARYGGLTPEGQRALDMARQIVGDTRRLREEMRSSTHHLSGRVRLAVIPTALTWAAWLVTRFAADHPNVAFTIHSATSAEILSRLENLEIDAGLTYLDNEPLGRVARVPIYRETYVLVCRPDHPLAARAALGWGDLGGLRLCLLTPDMQNRRIINRNFMEAGLEPDAPVEASATLVLASLVAQGDFVTILPTGMGQFLAHGGDLVAVPVTGGHAPHAVGLVAQYHDPQTPVLRALFQTAQRIAERE